MIVPWFWNAFFKIGLSDNASHLKFGRLSKSIGGSAHESWNIASLLAIPVHQICFGFGVNGGPTTLARASWIALARVSGRGGVVVTVISKYEQNLKKHLGWARRACAEASSSGK
jgi:hypothetical protein